MATTSMKGLFFFFFFLSILALLRSSIPEAKFGQPPKTSQLWRQNPQFHRILAPNSWPHAADHAQEQQRHSRAYVIRTPTKNAQTERIRTMVTKHPTDRLGRAEGKIKTIKKPTKKGKFR